MGRELGDMDFGGRGCVRSFLYAEPFPIWSYYLSSISIFACSKLRFDRLNVEGRRFERCVLWNYKLYLVYKDVYYIDQISTSSADC